MATLSVRQQTIADRVQKLSEQLGISQDYAFARLVHYAVTGSDFASFDESNWVDGGQDKQIDIISVELTSEDEALVFIIQAKYTTKDFSSDIAIKMGNGLDWIFRKDRKDINELTNGKLKDQILAVRDIQAEVLSTNMKVFVYYATNGLTDHQSDEFRQEVSAIKKRYNNGEFESFEFVPFGAEALVDCLDGIERSNRKIDEAIEIVFDVNTPSFINLTTETLKGYICTTTGHEIARLVNTEREGDIFDLNVRRFLGQKGAVNKSIYDACSSVDQDHKFWFLNNGITIICDQAARIENKIKVKNMQIVNGCQTASTIALAEKNGHLAPEVKVLLRIYETKDTMLVDQIVSSTNTQNKISSRDLHANDGIQIVLEKAFAKYGLEYERKLSRRLPRLSNGSPISNEVVAQSYLAVVMKKPSDARSRRYKVWGEYYSTIYNNRLPVQPYIICFRLVEAAKDHLKRYREDESDLRRKVANTGAFHVARICAFLLKDGDNWTDSAQLQNIVEQLLQDATQFTSHIDEAIKILESIIQNNPTYMADLENALKSYKLDEDINKHLVSMLR